MKKSPTRQRMDTAGKQKEAANTRVGPAKSNAPTGAKTAGRGRQHTQSERGYRDAAQAEGPIFNASANRTTAHQSDPDDRKAS